MIWEKERNHSRYATCSETDTQKNQYVKYKSKLQKF